MTVVDFGAKRRGVDRDRSQLGGNRTAATEDATSSTARKPAPRAPSPIRGLGVISTDGGSAVVSGAVIPHPLDQEDVVAFLLVEGSDAATMLQAARTAEFSLERKGPGGPFIGPVELMRAHPDEADWFGRLVSDIFAAVGGTPADLAVHEATIGIPSTVVAFLRPEQIPNMRHSGSSAAMPAPSAPRRSRRVGHLVLLQGGRSD